LQLIVNSQPQNSRLWYVKLATPLKLLTPILEFGA
jgi:hypothetical protein